ncbi:MULTISPECIES: 4-hydroxythreonine-4-phosphate dehydrogenase PdxA [unclassified Burkholderia]|uniref:4-hydroxythreonine-4-phosphate dehydrogenase PdxA n=1 Tax=unclassified Burkholderia TaxID=2613784 RepID=UPI00142049DA|nr:MULTISPECIES: 4-hydroxythreonine-4-phosphate dehydrogenase PdxA [unclassified Burkholderia]NIE85282.1 4-hydroxythreonine-4-phosphate dehydrogenase PdxA [Burkholderia sp. Tr-860]NIF63206.1 4-hydroxythreonine-4-phosphate dehydrogenase PdxA [Burkholderia sp. Cy-647]NIF72294.1 4-hydroxythreonine-4-phosphate dehydrogenase PdxA [Burkholderia sp. Ap-962]NIF87156.1 4-hydroxythreonine-4-phosphate dehydrogenase PdxA [Burkholderia sp. Cy-637]NIF95474.1 4-hydroxythreonine-4-phosphate dehydrogenase PdxA
MSPSPIRIALSIGDPAGIGAEIIARLLADPDTARKAEILLIGNREALARGAAAAGVPLPQAARWLEIPHWAGSDAVFEAGVVSEASGRFMLDSLRLAVRHVQEGSADAVCFGPLNKGALRLGGMREEDEMRWFASQLGHRGVCGELNVLGSLWTARVTSHIPLREVSAHLSPEAVADAIGMLSVALRASGVAAPRIGVCGLNPHNGDHGNYGSEERDVIEPGMALAATRGFEASGPYPADTIFLRARAGQLDGIVTMYHDQGQIATKLLGFEIGVTVEGGLPIPVTTPAHGTAYDIVGQGRASATAMAHAFDLACRMASTRTIPVA